MYNRLKEVKAEHEHGKKTDFKSQTLHPRDIDWLIEQAEKVEQYEKALEEINKFSIYYDEKGWALNPYKIGGIATKALDGKGTV